MLKLARTLRSRMNRVISRDRYLGKPLGIQNYCMTCILDAYANRNEKFLRALDPITCEMVNGRDFTYDEFTTALHLDVPYDGYIDMFEHIDVPFINAATGSDVEELDRETYMEEPVADMNEEELKESIGNLLSLQHHLYSNIYAARRLATAIKTELLQFYKEGCGQCEFTGRTVDQLAITIAEMDALVDSMEP